jgi:hypothetical protein
VRGGRPGQGADVLDRHRPDQAVRSLHLAHLRLPL